MYWNQWMGHGFFMPWMILFPVIVVLFLVMMRSNGCSSHRKDEHEDEALDIIRKRFARGEIDEEAFEKIKEKLTH